MVSVIVGGKSYDPQKITRVSLASSKLFKMIPSLHNGVSALKSLTQGLQVLGNNIANVNSLGYKSSRANYSDNFYMHLNDAEIELMVIPVTTSSNMERACTPVPFQPISTKGLMKRLVWIWIWLFKGSSSERRRFFRNRRSWYRRKFLHPRRCL